MSNLGRELSTTGSRSTVLWGFIALAIALVAEVVWYPELASIIRGSGAGSAVGFFRDAYVLPVAIAFAAAIAIGVVLVRRKHGERVHFLLYGAWAANLLLLAFSLWFYLEGVATAGEYK